MAARLRGGEFVANLRLVVQPDGEEAALLELDGYAVFARERLLGAGRERVGAPRYGTGQLRAQVYVAARLEGRELCRTCLGIRHEDEALRVVRLLHDFGYFEVLRLRVQPFCQLIDLIGLRQGFGLGGGYHLRAVLAEVLEFQHVENADESDLYIHLTQPPSSCP